MGVHPTHLLLLAREWEAEFRGVDFDRVEAKIIRSQLHTKLGSGKNKAKAIRAATKSLFGRKLAALSAKLAGNNAQDLLGGSEFDAPLRRGGAQ